ncbi:outer membrane receptor protein involved in Fe transport [Lewinella aquimaris]|uniref:Outer membrane receptor protein involved in Fe transport n=1 Tax=Neolewinella aquimaris TaxID=1835722 RepID=A0A840E8Y8_9BACT|nr:outer membrane receptor protein involved in Fe transport [Neolewinella aquimaris]
MFSRLENATLKVIALGYAEIYTPVDPTVLHYEITVEPIGETLSEVTVRGRKLLFEQRTDRLVMNVTATPALSGNNALQVLQKAPGVLVNHQNSSISLGSRGEVLLMIGDRVQRAPAAVIFARLEAMPAESIEAIEIIHQPPSKYDASGVAGIIRIVMRSTSSTGTRGDLSLTGGYGRGPKAIAGLRLNSRYGKINLFGDYNYNLNYRRNTYALHYRDYKYQGTRYFYENNWNRSEDHLQSHSGSLGFDLELGPKTILGGGTSLSHSRGLTLPSSSQSAAFENGQPVTSTLYILESMNSSSNGFANLNLQRDLGAGGQLTVDLDYAGIRFTNESSLTGRDSLAGTRFNGDRKTPVKIWTGRIDHKLELGKGKQLETGVKGTFSDIVSRSRVFKNGGEEWETGDLFTRTDSVSERILAAYVSLQSQFSARLHGEIGLRFEHYSYRLETSLENLDVDLTWNNLFPLVRLNYDLDTNTTVQLSFNRSVTRPPFFMMAAVFMFFDPTFFAYANPTLQPAFGSTIRLALQWRASILSLSYTRSQNDIFFQNTVNKPRHLQIVYPDNLDRADLLSLELSTNSSLTSWWDMNGTLGLRYHRVEDEEGRPSVFTNDMMTFSAQFNATFSMGKGWLASIDGRYQSDFLLGDQVQYAYPYLNLGLQKKFERGTSVSLSVQDPTNTLGRLDWRYDAPWEGISTYGFSNFSEPQLRLTLTTPFGDERVKEKRARVTGAEDIRKRL